ncbi:glycoside hydrolase family 3 N-terminal domain-containing protein [Brachybacterium sacelli]|uniref:Beta-N-acetylhexosaminidase n=1 Tax=Brachybacterium sacelli TaxID=173364 RepID=A0ABS4X3P3_9MICO|nr:glycoside hydrolase family 3 N-terminal domain-containing protein [Brachybacterium sacelli]MBP2383013.1 beta-N-acetylhexosaminidase [Brachybacterium sacelli]
MTSSPLSTDPVTWDADALGVLMAPFTGTELPAWITEALEAGLASVILFGHNTPDPSTAARLARAVHARAVDCVVAIDEEGGDVTRLQAATGSALPTAWALGEVDDSDLTRRVGHALGGVLAACDLDLDLAPVLDVSTDPANPVIGTRSYSGDPDRVAAHARAFATGLVEAGLGTCAKHFPGHGATSTDSHTALPRIDVARQDFERDHLAPWRILPWLDAAMSAHVLVPALGEGPASISAWTRPLLDRVVGGTFRGLLVTDALEMKAVAADPGFPEAVVRAIESGADLLCLGTSMGRDDQRMLREAHDALVGAVTSGRLRREDLHARAERTREHCRALRTRRRFVPAPELDEALRQAEQLGADAAARAVRVRGARLDLAPVTVLDLRSRADHASGARPQQLVTALRERGLRADVPDYPDQVPDTGGVLAITRLPRSDREEGERLAALLERRPEAVVVHVGVPDAAPEHRHLVLAHGAGRALMRAAVDAMLREGR